MRLDLGECVHPWCERQAVRRDRFGSWCARHDEASIGFVRHRHAE